MSPKSRFLSKNLAFLTEKPPKRGPFSRGPSMGLQTPFFDPFLGVWRRKVPKSEMSKGNQRGKNHFFDTFDHFGRFGSKRGSGRKRGVFHSHPKTLRITKGFGVFRSQLSFLESAVFTFSHFFTKIVSWLVQRLLLGRQIRVIFIRKPSGTCPFLTPPGDPPKGGVEDPPRGPP